MSSISTIPVPTESQEMQVLAQWLDFIGVLWTHPPNESKGPIQHHVARARSGVKAGVPDVLIFEPPPSYKTYKGCAIELKRVKGGRTSPEQEVWLERLASLGWTTSTCKGASEAIAWLKTLGYGGK